MQKLQEWREAPAAWPAAPGSSGDQHGPYHAAQQLFPAAHGFGVIDEVGRYRMTGLISHLSYGPATGWRLSGILTAIYQQLGDYL